MISIVAVNCNTLDWMKLLVQSVRKFTTVPYEIIIVDNNSEDGSQVWLKEQRDVLALMMNRNFGHGKGLDFGINYAEHPFIMVMDIDAHLQRKGWDLDFFDLYTKDKDIKLIAAKGGDPEGKLTCQESIEKWATANAKKKPIHACFQFFNKKFFKENKLSFEPREGQDVGRKNYFDIIGLGYKVHRIAPGYEDAVEKRKFYPGSFGDNYYLFGEPFLYHNWYSARMWRADKVDNVTRGQHFKGKEAVFNHPFVKEILS